MTTWFLSRFLWTAKLLFPCGERGGGEDVSLGLISVNLNNERIFFKTNTCTFIGNHTTPKEE